MTIRRASESDSARLTTLAREAKAHWGYPKEWLAQWSKELTIDPSYLNVHRVFVADIGGWIVGSCALEDHQRWWRLEHVWVDPQHQRTGIGGTLVRHALTEAGVIRPGVVMVEADPHAAGFYRRLGGRDAGSLPAPMPGDPGRRLSVIEMRTAEEA